MLVIFAGLKASGPVHPGSEKHAATPKIIAVFRIVLLLILEVYYVIVLFFVAVLFRTCNTNILKVLNGAVGE